MREIRQYGSEGGAAGQPAVPTPIGSWCPNCRWVLVMSGCMESGNLNLLLAYVVAAGIGIAGSGPTTPGIAPL